MKIDLGNFGYQTREAADARVNYGDPTAMAQAREQVANMRASSAAHVQQAWGQAVNAGEQLGMNILQAVREKAKLEAGNHIQQFEADANSKLLELGQQAQQGQIRSEEIQPAFQKFRDEYKLPDVSGLGPTSGEAYKAAFQERGNQIAPRFQQLAIDTHRDETRRFLDKQSELQNNNSIARNESPSQGAAWYDQDWVRRAATEAYGGSAEEWISRGKQGILKSHAVNLMVNAHDDYNGIGAARQAITDPNGEFKDMDVDTKMSLDMQGDNRQHALRNEAIARENARQTALLRAENVAGRAYDHMEKRLQNQETPTAQDWEQFRQVTAGTQTDAAMGGMSSMLQRQQYYYTAARMTDDQIDQRVAQINAITNTRDANGNLIGGSETLYNERDALIKFQEKRAKDADTNPVGMMEWQGAKVRPVINYQQATQSKEGMDSLAAELIDRNADISQAKAQFGPKVKDMLNKPGEQKNFEAWWGSATPDQRIDLVSGIRQRADEAGQNGDQIINRLMAPLKDVDANSVSIAGIAHTPQGRQYAVDMDNGLQIMKKGAINPPRETDIMSDINKVYGDTLTPTQKQQYAKTMAPILIGRGMTKDSYSSSDAREVMGNLFGKRVQVTSEGFSSHAHVVAPPGVDENRLTNSINEQLDALPGDLGQSIRNGLDTTNPYSGRPLYSLVYGEDGNLRVYDGRSYKGVAGKEIVIKVPR